MLYPYSFERLAARKGIRGDKIAGAMACAILLFFMAFRANTVGVDTKYYTHVYSQFADIPWKDIFSATLYGSESENGTFILNLEPGYRFLNKLLSCFFPSPQTIIVVSSIIIIVLLYQFVKSDSQMSLLSLWLYITLGIYQTEMNVSRNAIAIFICYLAFYWVRRKKPLLFLLCVLIAATIHQTALFFLPLYWLVNNVRLNGKRMLILVAVSSLLGLNFSTVGAFLSSFLPYRYARYLTGADFNIRSVLVGVFSAVLYLMVLWFMNASERSKATQTLTVGNWMFTLNLCAFGLNLGIEAGARLAALFGPYIIYLIPQMLECIESPKQRALAAKCIVVVSFLQFAARLMINNIGGTMPYQFFWSQV